MGYHTRTMKSHKELPSRRPKLFKNPPKTLFDDEPEDFDAPIRGPLFPSPVFYTIVAVFGVSAMLTMDWFGLLLLNSQGVYGRLGVTSALQVTAALMSGICVPSALLMHHYNRLSSYTCDKNVFFAITFSISFMLGLPCALAWIFA